MSTTTDERKAEERDDEKRDDEKRGEDGGGKKKRRWLKWVLGAILLVILIVVAVVVLGGSSTTKEPPPPSGSLLAGKQQLLPLSPSGKLNASTGQKVVGKHEIVRSVVRGQGFWVGGSDVDRVFVRYPPAGRNVGAQVALTGTVKPLPINVAKSFGLSRRDAAKVTAEGAYIKATKVSPAGAQP